MAKSKWETHVKDKLSLVEGWARDGLIDEQIAKNLGIGYTTLKEYKNKYPSFLAALKKGKEVVDLEVENALLKRALGYQHKEIKETIDGNGNKVITRVLKDVPADTTAQIFWLKNRRPDKWRDKNTIQHEGEIKTNNPFAGLTTEELRKVINNDK